MPTWKGMFHVRGFAVACVVALVPLCALSVAGAATPPTTSGSAPTTVPPTTPTTRPAPPSPFALPTDFGLQLVLQQEQAKADLAAAQLALAPSRRERDRAQKEDTLAQKQLKGLSASARATEAKLDKTRAHLRVVAAQAYIHANSGQLAAAVSSLMNSKSAVEAASQLHIISTYGTNEKDALSEYLSLKERVDRQVQLISDLRDRTSRRLQSAKQRLADVEHAIADATTRIKDTLVGIAKFQEAATSASSPILGPSRLSANQMADYVMSSGAHPRITAPLVNLAQMYLDEGGKTGVRGDVAFAQSILETGGFGNPGAAATDNNFAGIGWCDSCAHGFNFPDAQTGVRAQLQLLRIYVDPAFPDANYKEPILLPGTLSLGFRGRVQTWWDLWGTWATGALYGQRVYDIYQRMIVYAAGDPPLPPPKPLPPADPKTPTTVGFPTGAGPGTKKP